MGPDNAAIMQPLTPIAAAILGALTGYEALGLSSWFGWFKIIGILSGVGGAVIMQLSSLQQHQSTSSLTLLLGNLCFIGNTTLIAFYILYQKHLLERYPSTFVAFYAALFGIGFAWITTGVIAIFSSSLFASIDAIAWLVSY